MREIHYTPKQTVMKLKQLWLVLSSADWIVDSCQVLFEHLFLFSRLDYDIMVLSYLTSP